MLSKIRNIIFVALFLTWAYCFTVSCAITSLSPDERPNTSNIEGRALSTTPTITLKSTLSHEWQDQIENFISDQHPFRAQLTTANGYLNYKILNRSQTPQVIIGDKGWLFFDSKESEKSDTIADYQGTNLLTKKELKAIKDDLVSLNESLNNSGRKLIIFVPPNKETMYGEGRLPDYYGELADHRKVNQLIEYLDSSNSGIDIINPEQALRSASTALGVDLYFKTDTHWNNLGAYIGTRRLLNELGLNVRLPNNGQYRASRRYGGDEARMMALAAFFEDVEYTIDIEMPKSKASLLMLHDSFGSAMKPFLDDSFKDTQYFAWSQFTEKTIRDNPSDIVVAEITERYLYAHLSKLIKAR